MRRLNLPLLHTLPFLFIFITEPIFATFGAPPFGGEDLMSPKNGNVPLSMLLRGESSPLLLEAQLTDCRTVYLIYNETLPEGNHSRGISVFDNEDVELPIVWTSSIESPAIALRTSLHFSSTRNYTVRQTLPRDSIEPFAFSRDVDASTCTGPNLSELVVHTAVNRQITLHFDTGLVPKHNPLPTGETFSVLVTGPSRMPKKHVVETVSEDQGTIVLILKTAMWNGDICEFSGSAEDTLAVVQVIYKPQAVYHTGFGNEVRGLVQDFHENITVRSGTHCAHYPRPRTSYRLRAQEEGGAPSWTPAVMFLSAVALCLLVGATMARLAMSRWQKRQLAHIQYVATRNNNRHEQEV